MKVLVCGGAGYIGSHTVVELISAGYTPIIADNLFNSSAVVIDRIEEITGVRVPLYVEDLCSEDAVRRIFGEHSDIGAVIHFAGYKAVGESVEKPLEYYTNNVGSALAVLRVMQEFNCRNFVFSSSATVYGVPERLPMTEGDPLSAMSPYGNTKIVIENILRDLSAANPRMNIALLRYFNPIGAHKSGRIGEDPKGIPNNLLPYVAQTAAGIREIVKVNGNDYDTHDGTCVRDYIHVVDLAAGHVAALKKLEENSGLVTYNLGTGKGSSVLEVIAAFSRAVGRQVPYEFGPRRAGDIDASYASPALAEKELGWSAQHTLDEMCEDSWNWQKNNPSGYEG